MYLKAGVPTLLERIAKRGRDFERDISPDYLTRLNHLYNAWIDSFTRCPILTIDADRLNFVRRQADFDEIAAQISTRLNSPVAV
ncbi:MAG: deoxynucleoside kinase [Anaerolineae bacterium]